MDNPLILVIDDSQTIRKLVECHLSQAGLQRGHGRRRGAGLELAASLRRDLILLDHQLPRHDRRRRSAAVCWSRSDREDPGRHQLGYAEPGLRQSTPSSQRRRPDPEAVHPRDAQERSGECSPDGRDGRSGPADRLRHPESVGEVHDALLEGTTDHSRCSPCSIS